MSNVKGSLKSKACLKNKFKQLIETLRNRTLFKEQIKDPLYKQPSQQQIQQRTNDILPVTQINSSPNQHIFNHENESNSSQNSSDLIRFHIKQLSNMKDIQEYINEDIQNESMYQLQANNRFLVNQLTDLLRPQEKLQIPKNQGRSGCIRRQRFTSSKVNGVKQPRYIKMPRISQKQAKQLRQEKKLQLDVQKPNSIKQVNDIEIIKYWNSSKKINDQSTMEEMYIIFTQLIDTLNIVMVEPVIKKYKNCVYFGSHPQISQQYEGIIYYFNNKLYYGELLNGNKHGKGTEINFGENIKYSGTFDNGKKNGFFYVQKEKENYEGMLFHGIYQGEGKLMTEDYVYVGTFQNGKKHGFGEEYYPKTGLRLKGCFKNGQYQNLDKSKVLAESTSEVEVKSKPSKVVTKNNAYDIDSQLQNTFKKLVQGSFINKQILSNVKTTSKAQQNNSLEDSKSLYDILTNKTKTNKYDYSIESNMQFPKIKLEGIHTHYKESNPQLKTHKINDDLVNSRLESPVKKRYHSQQQKYGLSTAEIELPLAKRKFILPIN